MSILQIFFFNKISKSQFYYYYFLTKQINHNIVKSVFGFDSPADNDFRKDADKRTYNQYQSQNNRQHSIEKKKKS